MWPEINNRVNYPLKEALAQPDKVLHMQSDLPDEPDWYKWICAIMECSQDPRYVTYPIQVILSQVLEVF